ncbi:hypothetical protein SNR37_003146 [Agarivorans aestuarii]|uniref:Uncharacterized protein n=1 Tax=Agarivorans aestuarii TaxID=1563703 RepID=A0ABU7G3G4_9ALTE|nr:hypothetical protein [Agarivorans aestuarii]MEE1673719.1 hypothetical protein [Agarivorans aestuarii]
MDSTEWLKLLLAFIPAIGTYSVLKFNQVQTMKIKAELIEKLSNAMNQPTPNKHSVTELFALIHKVKFKFEDIIALCDDSDCAKITQAVRTAPNLITYENGRVVYTGIGLNRFFRWLDKYHTFYFYWFSVIALTSSAIATLFGEGSIAIIGMMGTVFATAWFATAIKDRKFAETVDYLIERSQLEDSQALAVSAEPENTE